MGQTCDLGCNESTDNATGTESKREAPLVLSGRSRQGKPERVILESCWMSRSLPADSLGEGHFSLMW